MKATVTTILALAGVATVSAADFPDNMPECGRKTCGPNMLAKAAEFGCGQDDLACLCRNENFGYGVHDCSIPVCGNVDDANAVISWANNLCSSLDVNSPTVPSANPADFLSSSPSPASTSEVVSTVTSDGSTFVTTSTVSGSDDDSTESGDATPITTSTWTSVFTSGDVTTTLTGETTVSGISGVPGATSVPETTFTSEIVSTHTEDSTTFETTVGTSTFVSSVTGDALSSALSSQASENPDAETSTSSGQGAQMTAAPALGALAAAGIAAAFL